MWWKNTNKSYIERWEWLHSCPNFTKMALVVFFALPIDNVFAQVQIIQVLSNPSLYQHIIQVLSKSIIIPIYRISISLRTTYFTKFFITSRSDRLRIVENKSNVSDWSCESDRPSLALVTSHLTKLCPKQSWSYLAPFIFNSVWTRLWWKPESTETGETRQHTR